MEDSRSTRNDDDISRLVFEILRTHIAEESEPSGYGDDEARPRLRGTAADREKLFKDEEVRVARMMTVDTLAKAAAADTDLIDRIACLLNVYAKLVRDPMLLQGDTDDEDARVSNREMALETREVVVHTAIRHLLRIYQAGLCVDRARALRDYVRAEQVDAWIDRHTWMSPCRSRTRTNCAIAVSRALQHWRVQLDIVSSDDPVVADAVSTCGTRLLQRLPS